MRVGSFTVIFRLTPQPLFLWNASLCISNSTCTGEVKIVLPVYISLNTFKLNTICQCVPWSLKMSQYNCSVSDFRAHINRNNLLLLENLSCSTSTSLVLDKGSGNNRLSKRGHGFSKGLGSRQSSENYRART